MSLDNTTIFYISPTLSSLTLEDTDANDDCFADDPSQQDIPQNQRLFLNRAHWPVDDSKSHAIDLSRVGLTIEATREADIARCKDFVSSHRSLVPRSSGAKSRLYGELASMDCPNNITVVPIGENLMSLCASFEGPIDSPYEGGIFHMTIDLAPSYPILPPVCRLVTKIYHPNIDRNGTICTDILGSSWSPAITIRALLLSISSMLDTPEYTDPLVPEIAQKYFDDKVEYEDIARDWTKRYAATTRTCEALPGLEQHFMFNQEATQFYQTVTELKDKTLDILLMLLFAKEYSFPSFDDISEGRSLDPNQVAEFMMEERSLSRVQLARQVKWCMDHIEIHKSLSKLDHALLRASHQSNLVETGNEFAESARTFWKSSGVEPLVRNLHQAFEQSKGSTADEVSSSKTDSTNLENSGTVWLRVLELAVDELGKMFTPPETSVSDQPYVFLNY